MKKRSDVIYHVHLAEPIHEYFVTICDNCKEELPDKYDEFWGNFPEPGDKCPYCGSSLAELKS